MPEFRDRAEERERRKQAELAPYIEKALARKQWMPAIADDEIPVVYASSDKVQINR